jgi:aminoglycoside phosphotransferase (APT) family kinase protein
MEQRIAEYLSYRMPDVSDVVVEDLARIYGGSSQETYRLRARWNKAGAQIDRKLILRREPPSGLVVAERDLEYQVYRALEGSSLPVPKAYFLELDGRWLERPFFIMDMCAGQPGNPMGPADPYNGHDDKIGRQFYRHLGTLAAVDHTAAGLGNLRNGAQTGRFWALELDHWEATLNAGERFVDPIARAAIRWLRRNPPPEAAKPAIVHGDYRSGNFLFTDDGQISAILDWEMCHIGDPLEDIAWSLDVLWPMSRHISIDEGLAQWEAASGLSVDRKALDWWRLFAPVKALGLWATAEASFTEGKSRELIVALTGWRGGYYHRQELLRQMAERRAAA